MTKIIPTSKLDPSKIIIATQCSPVEPFKSEVIRLFKSQDLLGGQLADAQKIVCLTEPADLDFKNELEELGVAIQSIEPIDVSYPYSNKIQMLQIEEDYDVLIALDTDIIITGDFSDYIDKNKISAKGVDTDCLGLENWEKLFKFFKLQMPSKRFQTSITNVETVPWFNSGVLFIPKKFSSILYELWIQYTQKLLQNYNYLTFLSGDSFDDNSNFTFIEQYALTLAIHDLKLPYNQLSLKFNFPTHYLVHENFNPNEINPLIIHYHHLVSKKGNILHSKYLPTTKRIDLYNKSITTVSSDDNEIIIDDLYLSVLGRHADQEGLDYFMSLLSEQKISIDLITKSLMNSDEFKNK
ncbi:MAG: hypothetical protein CXT78_00475 [Thaumarchaeota archaeon]|nr:MAG: hypothetical protein CXT78_00475 [Nitrososphaerota archaeon]